MTGPSLHCRDTAGQTWDRSRPPEELLLAQLAPQVELASCRHGCRETSARRQPADPQAGERLQQLGQRPGSQPAPAVDEPGVSERQCETVRAQSARHLDHGVTGEAGDEAGQRAVLGPGEELAGLSDGGQVAGASLQPHHWPPSQPWQQLQPVRQASSPDLASVGENRQAGGRPHHLHCHAVSLCQAGNVQSSVGGAGGVGGPADKDLTL